MMKLRPHLIGLLIGVAAAMVFIEARSRLVRPAPAATMISECDGSLDELVIHYVAGDEIAAPVYRSFLPQLPAGVSVYVLCPDRSSFDELLQRVGEVSCRLLPIVTGHEMTVWSRDRWVALAADGSESITLLSSKEEDAAALWPQRAGDARAAFDLANALAPRVAAKRLPIRFDAGDLLADRSTVFVTPAVLMKNLQRTVESRQELIDLLGRELNRRIVLLDNAPDHHAGMFMMAVGNRTMLVGDIRAALHIYGDAVPQLPGGTDVTEQAIARLDNVAAQVADAGYKIERIPILPSRDQKTYFTYVNVLINERDGKRTVYMPTYADAGALNEAAAGVWRSLGYEVRAVDCSSSYRHFGNLHCLVNVLRRTARNL